MHIYSIHIENFRAIRFLDIEDLSSSIVIAGPNGCGKSSIFDAIRLLKSAYGQYQRNEYQQFFQEFQINIKQLHREGKRVFHDPERPLLIEACFKLTEKEREYLQENSWGLLQKIAWAQDIRVLSTDMILEDLDDDPVTSRTRQPVDHEKA